MQETPNFQSYLTRFNQFALSALIDGAQPVAEPQRSVIEDAYNKLSLYLTDNQYRDKLTTVSRNNIEGQINSILAQFDQITSLLQTNPPSLTSSLESISNNIQSYLEELNLRFYNPYQTYLLQNQGNVGAIVNEITNFRKEAEKSEAETKKVLDKAKLTVGIGASISLADQIGRAHV